LSTTYRCRTMPRTPVGRRANTGLILALSLEVLGRLKYEVKESRLIFARYQAAHTTFKYDSQQRRCAERFRWGSPDGEANDQNWQERQAQKTCQADQPSGRKSGFGNVGGLSRHANFLPTNLHDSLPSDAAIALRVKGTQLPQELSVWLRREPGMRPIELKGRGPRSDRS
jgi:hypothetical protein